MKIFDRKGVCYNELSGPEIEKKSFEIIQSELGLTPYKKDELPIVIRVIHATADFDFSKIMAFHGQAVKNGLASIKKGRSILTDVNMVASGISTVLCNRYGIDVLTPIGTQECAELAAQKGITRAAAAMEIGSKQGDVGIVAVGNAPTALLHLFDLIEQGLMMPDLIVGVPVGFVNAAESKEILSSQDKVPFITAKGRKGGSPVAAAIINAMLRMAK